jgi:hypothetical protein
MWLGLWSIAAAADVQLVHQGRLLGADGNPVSGAHDLTVRLYNHATSTSAGNVVFTQVFDDHPVDAGYFSVSLGSGSTALSSSVFSQPLWVGVTVGAGAEIAPRPPIHDVPVAAHARGVTLGAVSGTCGTTVAAGTLRYHAGALEVCSASGTWSGVGSSTTSGPTGGLVAYWPLDRDWLDRSGNGYPLAPEASAMFTESGKFSQAFVGDGSGDRARATGIGALSGNATFTVGAWFRTDDTSLHKGIIGVGNTGNRQHFYLRAGNGGDGCSGPRVVMVGADDGATDKWWCSTTTLNSGVWYHAAATYDGALRQLKIYVNGGLERTVTLSQDLALTGEVSVGGDLHNDNYLPGRVDDAVVYSRVLSATEIANLAGGAPVMAPATPPAPSGPLAVWHLDNAWTDATGNGYTLSPAGNATFSASGQFSAGITLDGAGDRATAVIPPLAGHTSRTLLVWAYPTNTSMQEGPISSGSTGLREHFFIRLGDWGNGCTSGTRSILVGADNGAADMWWCGTSHIAANQWHLIVATYDAPTRTLRAYRNGTLERTVVLSENMNFTADIQVGGDLYNDNYFDGRLDEAAVWGRALSPAEVTAIWESGAPL